MHTERSLHKVIFCNKRALQLPRVVTAPRLRNHLDKWHTEAAAAHEHRTHMCCAAALKHSPLVAKTRLFTGYIDKARTKTDTHTHTGVNLGACVSGVMCHTCVHTLREIHTREIHTREIHTREIHTREIHTREIDTREIHTREIHTREIHTREIHTREIDTREIDTREIHTHTSQGTRFRIYMDQGHTRTQPLSHARSPHPQLGAGQET